MLQIVLSGLVMGCIYALIALGFVLIYNACGAINFAQGDLVVVCGFLIVGIVAKSRMAWPIELLLVLVGVVCVAFVFQWIAYRPLQNKPFVTVFISTIGIGIAMRNLVQIGFGPDPRSLPPLFPGTLKFFGVVLSDQYVFAAAVTVVLLVALHLFLNRTNLGAMMRASAQDPETARLVGVRVDRIVSLTFVLSTLLAAAAAFLLAPIFFLTPNMGDNLILKAFTAAVIGGLGSLPGAIFGGITMGLVEYLASGYVSSHWKDAIAFTLLMGFLILRPQGIFGESVSEKV